MKKKSPTIVLDEDKHPFAANRAAKRALKARGIAHTSVPMPTLRAYCDGELLDAMLSTKKGRWKDLIKYDMVTAEGARLPFTPEYVSRVAKQAARSKY